MKYVLVVVFILGINGTLMSLRSNMHVSPFVKTSEKNQTKFSTSKPQLSFKYTAHVPIEISDNTEFNSSNGVTGGSGTVKDPYIIEGWNITCDNQSGIRIYNTTNFFQVRNCWVKGGVLGIFVSHVSVRTAIIVNNIVQTQDKGSITTAIWIAESGNSTVNHNTCKSGWGIWLTYSGNSTVANNNCTQNGRGIWIHNSASSIVANNVCNKNIGGRGNGDGIRLEKSNSSIVEGNICNKNYRSGIIIDSSNITIKMNILRENEGGVRLYGENNTIHHNTFINNTIQAYDDGASNQWYDSETYEGNYWSDYLGNGSYLITGSAGVRDLYPLPQPPPTLSFIVGPTTETTDDFQWNVVFGIIVLLTIISILIFSNKYKKK